MTQIAGDDVWLMETTASTVALIVNELMQNSLKYAFPDREEGQIQMQIERGPRYSWVTVRDDGCGFDNKKVSTSSSGLGLRLINGLVLVPQSGRNTNGRVNRACKKIVKRLTKSVKDGIIVTLKAISL